MAHNCVQYDEIKVWSGNNSSSDKSSQQPLLPSPGVQLPTGGRIPMPLFDPPTRDENPIPERESNILSCSFPSLFQTGDADINAPRLRSLENEKENHLEAFTRFVFIGMTIDLQSILVSFIVVSIKYIDSNFSRQRDIS